MKEKPLHGQNSLYYKRPCIKKGQEEQNIYIYKRCFFNDLCTNHFATVCAKIIWDNNDSDIRDIQDSKTVKEELFYVKANSKEWFLDLDFPCIMSASIITQKEVGHGFSGNVV